MPLTQRLVRALQNHRHLSSRPWLKCDGSGFADLSAWLQPSEADPLYCSFQDFDPEALDPISATTLTQWYGTPSASPFRQAQARAYGGVNECQFFESGTGQQLPNRTLITDEEVAACRNVLITFYVSQPNLGGPCL